MGFLFGEDAGGFQIVLEIDVGDGGEKRAEAEVGEAEAERVVSRQAGQG